MRFLVIDGQGGRLGKLLVEGIRREFSRAEIMAVGTNAVATATMLKAGADEAATGENPVIVASQRADIIAGPIGIVIADSLLGEVTPDMAVAVGQSHAAKVLVPMNRCDNLVAGVSMLPVGELVEDAIIKIKEAADNM
ncbi:DUF3842 family protein [Anaerovoracaceae bacterium 41-7]|jgi:hypothetical protein|uniref:DUF3842 family protein n=1 Tax=Anaerotruncus colihominis TaxID=169435 RepID=A0A845QMI3_9FIRM|nr:MULTISPECIES: DUF3842 family protein [Clostridia]MCI9476869.1 DUF3842 family protein [Emergencia sp.]MCI9640925.1 DUF3842 family protein [Emergencia sp.]NBH61268.1 DUF3842 family protein [Anaerotruncus colihominis]NCE98656.1 DUF3842 family protein [Emergencia sp. 1XD21-10]NCF01923.1 DUF3842 family protein [Anaerotruncus sp. 80]